ncbi:hypothetical protein NXW16_13725 [Bacteroides thetaiotaomicron]|nr:hypothetical protein [Bacteroides thetaiotaomicron]
MFELWLSNVWEATATTLVTSLPPHRGSGHITSSSFSVGSDGWADET